MTIVMHRKSASKGRGNICDSNSPLTWITSRPDVYRLASYDGAVDLK